MPNSTQKSNFIWPVRVYYEDTDAGAVVYYSNYLKFFERARTEMLRHLGLNQIDLANNEQLLFMVRKINLEYRLPAKLDDELQVNCQLQSISKYTLDFKQFIQCEGKILVNAEVQICCVHSQTLKLASIPSYIHNLFNNL